MGMAAGEAKSCSAFNVHPFLAHLKRWPAATLCSGYVAKPMSEKEMPLDEDSMHFLV
jgi:hypothetical protein